MNYQKRYEDQEDKQIKKVDCEPDAMDMWGLTLQGLMVVLVILGSVALLTITIFGL